MKNKTNKKKVVAKLRRDWPYYVLLLPAVVHLILFSYVPMYGVQIAFKNFQFAKGIWGSEWVGFDNFTRLFNSYWFPIILKNTLVISAISVLISFPLPIIFALSANELKNEKMKKFVQTVSYAPHFISTVVVCGMVIMFTSPSSGIINKIIELLGGEAVAFMQYPDMFKWVYSLSGMWQGTGWAAVIYFAALSGVDTSLLEAAEIDGASRLQRIWYINIPVLIPTISIQFILKLGQVLSVGSAKILLLQNATNLTGSEVISSYVYKVGLQQFDYSFSTATNIFNSICNCILLISANAISKKVSKQGLW